MKNDLIFSLRCVFIFLTIIGILFSAFFMPVCVIDLMGLSMVEIAEKSVTYKVLLTASILAWYLFSVIMMVFNIPKLWLLLDIETFLKYRSTRRPL